MDCEEEVESEGRIAVEEQDEKVINASLDKEPLKSSKASTPTTVVEEEEIGEDDQRIPPSFAVAESADDLAQCMANMSLMDKLLKEKEKTPEEKERDERVKIESAALAKHFEERVGPILESLGGMRPFHKGHELFDGIAVKLSHRCTIGDLFDFHDDRGNEKIRGEREPMWISLKADVSDFVPCDRRDRLDFTKCHVMSAIIVSYDNQFPFNFYWHDENFDNVVGLSNRPSRSTAKKDAVYDNNHNENNDNNNNNNNSDCGGLAEIRTKESRNARREVVHESSSAYKFVAELSKKFSGDASFASGGSESWPPAHLGFEHVLYAAKGLKGLVTTLSFGGCNGNGSILNGTACYDYKATVEGLPSTRETFQENGWYVFRKDHALCGVLLDEAETIDRRAAVEAAGGKGVAAVIPSAFVIGSVEESPAILDQKSTLVVGKTKTKTKTNTKAKTVEKQRKPPGARSEKTHATIKRKERRYVNRDAVEMTQGPANRGPVQGVVCRKEIAESVISTFEEEIVPQISPSNLENLEMRLFYVPEGIELRRYSEFIEEEDLASFKKRVFDYPCELNVELKLSFVVFEKQNYASGGGGDSPDKFCALYDHTRR